MSSLRKIFASLLIVGAITAGAVACGTDDTSKSSAGSKSSDTSEPSDDSDSAASIEAWCKKLEQLEKAEAELDDEEAIAMLEDLAKDAPGEIRADVESFASVGRALASLDEEDEEAVEAFVEKYPGDELDAAADRLNAFVKDTCGLDLESF